jgi:uncharacterized protein
MPLIVNLRHLAAHNLRLTGELPVDELEIETFDEAIRVREPLVYDLEVQKLEGGLLVQGRLALALDCRCVRCLAPFLHVVELAPWTAHLALEGEEAVLVNNDCVDLTPIAREDILLAFPQHPLCDPECGGLSEAASAGRKQSMSGLNQAGSPAWGELNKLKF